MPLMFHAKIQPNIASGSGEEVDFVIITIFSNGGAVVEWLEQLSYGAESHRIA